LEFVTFAKAEEFIDAVYLYAATVTHIIFSQDTTKLRIDSP